MPRIAPGPDYRDESVPVNPGLNRGYPVVVFGDHKFCAGASTIVQPMPGPHMHSQVEFNFVLEGEMTYWFDGRELVLGAGRLALFWGMIPHQVTSCASPTRFVVLYVPMTVFLKLPSLSRLRDAVFGGAMVEALDIQPYDSELFQRWRTDLLSADAELLNIVQDELTARVRRLDRAGWQDLRHVSPVITRGGHANHDPERAHHIEKMAQFIAVNALEDISTTDVAKAAGLHPNYAMTLFKQTLGLTIKQSISRHRLDTAQSLLIASDDAVEGIAYDCGFGSLSSFYAAFAQRFGTTPAAFRHGFSDKLG